MKSNYSAFSSNPAILGWKEENIEYDSNLTQIPVNQKFYLNPTLVSSWIHIEFCLSCKCTDIHHQFLQASLFLRHWSLGSGASDYEGYDEAEYGGGAQDYGAGGAQDYPGTECVLYKSSRTKLVHFWPENCENNDIVKLSEDEIE